MRYQPHEYTCIAAWGRQSGSFDYYIKAQQEKAAKEEAPITAIYRQSDGQWSVAGDIMNPQTRKFILGQLYVEEEHGQYGTEYDVEEDRFDRLPRVCAAFEFTEKKCILITRGEAGYTELPADFDVERFNKQRRINMSKVEAMLAGSIFGWHVPGADPKHYKEGGV